MKRLIIVFAILICLFLAACDVAMFETDDADSYRAAWAEDLPMPVEDLCWDAWMPSPVFPASVKGLDVDTFYARIDNTSFSDKREYQIYLCVSYSDEEFAEECARIEKLTTIVDSPYFDLPAAVTILGWEQCSEYALIDAENSTVHYVYIQSIQKDDVVFSHDYLPNDYSGYGNIKIENINIYSAMSEAEKNDIAQSRR